MSRWTDISRANGDVLPALACQELVDCCQRCLMNCSRAGLQFTPKFHFFSHLSQQARSLGNPKLHGCFQDGSLNLTLRNIAQGCLRRRQEERIFMHMNLLGRIGGLSLGYVLYGE